VSLPRILVFLHSFESGGVEKVALRLAAAWLSSGADVRVVVGRGEGVLRAAAPQLPYDILQTGRVSTRHFETLWMIALLPAAILRHRPDVIFCPGNTYAIVAVALKLVLGSRCPPIVMKVSNDLRRLDMPPLVRWAYGKWLLLQGRKFDRFVGLAAPMRVEIADAMRVPTARIDIVEDPALAKSDLDHLRAQRRPQIWPRAGRRFVAVGRLVAQKNFALLIEAFADMATSDDRLLILGDGPERGDLEKLVRSRGIAGLVDLPGYADPFSGWLSNADVFVLSSNYEGVPAVVIEALAASLPIVATNCCISMSALLWHGRLGRLVSVGNRSALAAAMRERLQTCGACARAHAARFTVEHAAPRYLDILIHAAGGPTRHGVPKIVASAQCAACEGSRRQHVEPRRLMDS